MTNTMVDQLGATRRDLLGRAAEIALTNREFAPVAERERRLSDPVVAAMLEAGLFTMARARSYGGLELDPVGSFRVVEEVARHDSAAGWNLNLSTATDYLLAWGLIHKPS